MKSMIIERFLIAITVLLSALFNLWIGLSAALLLLLAWGIHKQLLLGKASDSHSKYEEVLALSLQKLRANPYEGEIFGFTSRIQMEVREALDALGSAHNSTRTKREWVSVFPILFAGLQSLVTLSVITQSSVTFETWEVIALIVLPWITFPLLFNDQESRQ
jgi:hypothetical protein